MVVPVLMIVLLGMIQYGLLFLNLRHLALASRTGAKIAAEQAVFDITQIKNEVDRHLLSAGLSSGAGVVVLEHNVGSPVTTIISSDPGASCPLPDLKLPDATVVPEGCVRVTVCVPVTVLTPDLLFTFGFTFLGRDAHQSTLLAFEAL